MVWCIKFTCNLQAILVKFFLQEVILKSNQTKRFKKYLFRYIFIDKKERIFVIFYINNQ